MGSISPIDEQEEEFIHGCLSAGNTGHLLRAGDRTAAHISRCRKFPRAGDGPEDPLLRDAEKIDFLLTGIYHQHIVVDKQPAVNPSHTGKVMDSFHRIPRPYCHTVSHCGKISAAVGNCPAVPPLIDYLHSKITVLSIRIAGDPFSAKENKQNGGNPHGSTTTCP